MMSGFIYFTPKIANAADYIPLGLEYAFDAPPIVTQLAAKDGPDGLSGTALHNYKPSLPAHIEWHKAREDLYLGWNLHSPPTPAELRKPVDVSAGHQVRLRDGNMWTIPRVLTCNDRDPQRKGGLPEVYTGMDGDGAVITKIPVEHDTLIAMAERFLAAFESEAGVEAFPERHSLDFAVELLSVCYRLTLPEVVGLELLDVTTAEALVMDAMDVCERIKCRLPAAVTRKLDDIGINSWLHFMAWQISDAEDE
jgi:hypothetical protein